MILNEDTAKEAMEYINKKQSEVFENADYIARRDTERMYIILEMLEKEMRRTTCPIRFPLDYISDVTKEIIKEKYD